MLIKLPDTFRDQLYRASIVRGATFIAQEMRISTEVLKRLVEGDPVDEAIVREAESFCKTRIEG